MRPPRGFDSNGSRSIQYANPENYISTKHVDSALFAILARSKKLGISDAKRGQNLEAEANFWRLRPRLDCAVFYVPANTV